MTGYRVLIVAENEYHDFLNLKCPCLLAYGTDVEDPEQVKAWRVIGGYAPDLPIDILRQLVRTAVDLLIWKKEHSHD